jgi:hypothetical protein
MTNNKIQNLPLFIFDILMLPITLVRLGLIYYGGSRYNFEGYRVLDIMNHANKPFFNQDNSDDETNNLDYRIVIRDDSRLFPQDIKKYINIDKTSKVYVGNTINFLQDEMNISENKEDIDESFKNEYILNSIKDELNSVFKD